MVSHWHTCSPDRSLFVYRVRPVYRFVSFSVGRSSSIIYAFSAFPGVFRCLASHLQVQLHCNPGQMWRHQSRSAKLQNGCLWWPLDSPFFFFLVLLSPVLRMGTLFARRSFNSCTPTIFIPNHLAKRCP